MKKIKLALVVFGTLLMNLANANTVITRKVSGGGATGIYTVGLGGLIGAAPTQTFTTDLDTRTYTNITAVASTDPLESMVIKIPITLDGRTVTKQASLSTTVTPGSVIATYTSTDFDFPTYGYLVVVYYDGPGQPSYAVTKFSKP